MEAARTSSFTRKDYAEIIGQQPTEGSLRLVEERLRMPYFDNDELDHLVRASPLAIQAWMKRKAQLADGTRPGVPVCDWQSICHAIKKYRADIGSWILTPNLRKHDAWALAEAGLLRELAGLTIERIALVTQSTRSKIGRRLEFHAKLMTSENHYGERIGEVASKALATCHRSKRVESD